MDAVYDRIFLSVFGKMARGWASDLKASVSGFGTWGGICGLIQAALGQSCRSRFQSPPIWSRRFLNLQLNQTSKATGGLRIVNFCFQATHELGLHGNSHSGCRRSPGGEARSQESFGR